MNVEKLSPVILIGGSVVEARNYTRGKVAVLEPVFSNEYTHPYVAVLTISTEEIYLTEKMLPKLFESFTADSLIINNLPSFKYDSMFGRVLLNEVTSNATLRIVATAKDLNKEEINTAFFNRFIVMNAHSVN